MECDDVTEWMLSSMRLASLGNLLQYHNKVMLDKPPYHSEYLDDILGAIDKQYLLKFLYTTAYGEEKDMVLQPAFVRLFKQRWYVIGVKSEERGVKKQSSAAEGKANPCAEADDAFADEKKRVRYLEPEKIRIRAFYPEYNYIEEVP